MNENMNGESAEIDSSVFHAIRIISRWVIGFALVFVFIADVRWGRSAALGAAVSGGLASLEWLLSAYIGRRIATSEDGARTRWTLLFVVKSITIFVCAIFALFYLDPRGLAFGFGALFAGALVGALEAQFRASRVKP